MRIVVRGIPAPQGSKRPVRLGNGKMGMVESSRAVGPWREAVRAETQRTMNGTGRLGGPLAVTIVFALPRPASLPKKVVHPAKRPDIDKLARAVLDGLTEGGAWFDDGQVVRLYTTKKYASAESATGCVITIFLEES